MTTNQTPVVAPDSIDSQLDSNTLKKMVFLSESKKSMRPIGVVLIDDDTNRRCTIDMGRVTWADSTTEEYSSVQPERVALSDEQIEVIARQNGTGGWLTLSDMNKFARAILSAQADLIPANSGELEPHPPTRHCMCEECKPSFEADCLGNSTTPLTQPLIAEATRDDADVAKIEKAIAAIKRDAKAQLRDALIRLMSSDAGIAAATDEDLMYAINDDAADPIVREQAAAVLQARVAIAASKEPR